MNHFADKVAIITELDYALSLVRKGKAALCTQ